MQKSTLKSFNFSNKIKVNFDGGELSSDTGLLLIHEFCEQFGVKELLKQYLPENRDGDFIHDKPEIIYEEIIRIIAGYPTNNAVKFLKEDPVYQKIHDNKIASSPTCCRLEKDFSFEDVKQLQRIQEALIDQTYEIEKPEEVWLDLDTTYDPASPKLYGAKFNTHYQQVGFAPLVCFDGKTKDFIKGYLRPGNMYCSKKASHFLEPILQKYKKLGIKIKVRNDSGFACPKLYRICEKYNATYYTKLKMNAVIKRHFEEVILTDEVMKNREEVFAEFRYQAGSWKKERRVLCRVQWNQDQLFPVCSAIVTNDEKCTSEDGFDFYNGRAGIENNIEEGKNGFSWDHLSHKSFESNAVRFQIFLTAYLITQLFRRLCMTKETRIFTINTIRIMLLKVASKIVKNSRSFIFKCASGFPFQKLFQTVLENIQNLPSFAPG